MVKTPENSEALQLGEARRKNFIIIRVNSYNSVTVNWVATATGGQKDNQHPFTYLLKMQHDSPERKRDPFSQSINQFTQCTLGTFCLYRGAN
jgi:hypothetical protein